MKDFSAKTACAFLVCTLLAVDGLVILSRFRLGYRLTAAENSVRQLSTTRVLDQANLSALMSRLGTVVYNPPKNWLSPPSSPQLIHESGLSPDLSDGAPQIQKGTHPTANGAAAKLIDLRNALLGSPPCECATLFVFFSPTDCDSCLRQSENWQHLHESLEKSHIAVVGILDGYDLGNINAFLNAVGVGFPVLLDRPGVARAYFGIEETPYNVLVDADGKLVSVSPRVGSAEARQAFERAVRDIAQKDGTSASSRSR